MSNYKEDFDGSELIHSRLEKPIGNTFIYALMDEDENILYIGQSKDPVTRIANHTQSKEFKKFKFFECNPENVNQIEFALYAKYEPQLNRVPPLDNTYCSLDHFKMKNKCMRGKIKIIRDFIAKNPVKTRAGKYPIDYLNRMKEAVGQ
jgi:excinuclease UvrABC nuclease subunit